MRIIATGSYFTWQAANGRDLETSSWVMRFLNSKKRAKNAASSRQHPGSGGDGPVAQGPMNDLSLEHEALIVDSRPPHADLPPPYNPASVLLDGERQDITEKAPLTPLALPKGVNQHRACEPTRRRYPGGQVGSTARSASPSTKSSSSCPTEARTRTGPATSSSSRP